MSTGTLIGEASLCGNLTGISELNGSLSSEIMSLEGSLSTTLVVDAPEYGGPYEITPKAYDDQHFSTTGKLMTADLKVLKVPTYTTTNPSGGYNFIIAEE